MALGVDLVGSSVPVFGVFVWILIIWALIWKGLALWHTARNKQKIWFVFILILNTAGILPIIYLLFFRRKRIADFKLKPITKKVVKKKTKKRKKKR